MTNVIQHIRETYDALVASDKKCADDGNFDYNPMFELLTVEPKGINVNLYFREGDPLEDAMGTLFNAGLFEDREELPEYTTNGRVVILHNVRTI